MKTFGINPVFEMLRHPPMSSDQGYNSFKDLSVMGVAPTRMYFGDGYSGTTWVDVTGNDNLTLQAGNPTANVVGPVPNIVGVKGDGTAWFQGSSGPATGADDLIVACAVRWLYDAVEVRTFAATRVAGDGWQLDVNAGTTAPRFILVSDGATQVSASTGPNMASAQGVVIVGCVNRDENSSNGMRCFVNAIAGSGVNPYNTRAVIADSSALTVTGNDTGAGALVSGAVTYACALWKGALFSSGATGAAEMQAVASELTQRFAGVFPQRASSGNELITVTRATEDGVVIERNSIKNIYYLGNGLQVADDEGLLIQGAATNKCTYSYNMNSWTTKYYITSALNATGPDQITNYGSTISDGTVNDYHHCELSLGALTAEWYEVVVIGKNIYSGVPWLRTVLRNSSWTNNGRCYWNFANKTIGTSLGTGSYQVANPVIENWGNSIYCCRIFMKATTDSTIFQLLFTTTNTGEAYDADTHNIFEIYHTQVCLGKYRHSIIRTNGAQATRNALNINIDPDNIPSGDFTITGEFKLPTITSPTDDCVAVELSDGTTNNCLQIVAGGAAISSYAMTIVNGSGDSATIEGNFFDGTWHTFLCAYKAGTKTYYKLDAAATTHNHGLTLPAMTLAAVGRQGATSNEYYLNGKVKNIKVYNKYLETI